MKKVIKALFVCIFFITALSAFAQRVYTVGILPFEVPPVPPADAGVSGSAPFDSGISDSDAAEATSLVIATLSSCKSLTFVQGDDAKNADYLIRGQISRSSTPLSAGQSGQIVLSATTSETRTGRVLNTSRAQAPTLAAIPMLSFCTQLTDYIPYPGFIVGKWQSTIDMIDGPVTCIMEFRADRTVQVQQFDTWEHRGTDSLKYQAIGTGSYSFTGYHMRRNLNAGGSVIQTDAAMGVNLTLEDALPKYQSVSVSGLRAVFDGSWNSFELVNAGIPCGDNYSGPSVYPGAGVAYTKFTKIR